MFRATDRTESFASGACFSPEREVAEAYTDDPGFGGSKIVAIEVDVDRDAVLGLLDGRSLVAGRQARDAWERLAEALGVEEDDVRELRADAENLIHNAVNSPRNRRKLFTAGFEWVVYEDTFPAGAVTWTYLGPLMAIERERNARSSREKQLLRELRRATDHVRPWKPGADRAYIVDLAHEAGVEVSEAAPILLELHRTHPGGILRRLDLVAAADPRKLRQSQIEEGRLGGVQLVDLTALRHARLP